MARRKKSGGGDGGPAWLVTFSDLMTLLLTFFVLLLSMASMDSATISRISSFSSSMDHLEISGAGRVPERIRLAVAMLRDPDTVLEKKDRLKDLLFPEDVLPEDLPKGELEENLNILQHPEGVVIVLTEGLLFPPNSAEPDARGRKLLAVLTPVILSVNADVNISGHTDSATARGTNSYELSALRAKAALEVFLRGQIRPDRFSISGYGPDKPAYSDADAADRAKNRRVEILLKTAARTGGY